MLSELIKKVTAFCGLLSLIPDTVRILRKSTPLPGPIRLKHLTITLLSTPSFSNRFLVLINHQILSGNGIKENELSEACSRHGEKIYAYRILGNLKQKKHYQDLRVDSMVVLQSSFKCWDMMVWIGFIWLRIGTSGRNL